MHISSIPRWDTTRVVLGCCCYSFICNTAGCKCITGRGVGIALFVCLKAIVLAEWRVRSGVGVHYIFMYKVNGGVNQRVDCFNDEAVLLHNRWE